MKNTLNDLNNALFAALEDLQGAETAEELDREINRAHAVAGIAGMIIKNGELALKTVQVANEAGYGDKRLDQRELAVMPDMLRIESK